jgi:thiamine biosynthesis lipoprotein
MANPCEVLVDTDDRGVAESLGAVAAREAARVEARFSRYRPDTIVHAINPSAGRPIAVDQETAGLLDYAALCHETSRGSFDITSGALRRVWRFDGGEANPDPVAIQEALRHVGWHRVSWHDPVLVLPQGMEIDLGGIGKEYAVDRAASLCEVAMPGVAVLLNFGGDLFATGTRRQKRRWSVGLDDPARPEAGPVYRFDIERGGLATSGDAHRYAMWNGRRLSHILNPRTGWPVEDAPRSVTVLGSSCLEAGTLATLASLRGAGAQEFLEREGARYWIL